MKENISLSTFERLPAYLHYLQNHCKEVEYISATQIANYLNFGEVQVRKDLASVCSIGKPKIGYNVNELISNLQNYLGCNTKTEAIIVGVGNLGQALMQFKGFRHYGLEILAGFDINKELCDKSIEGNRILHVTKLEEVVKALNIKLAILTIPPQHAQVMADLLVRAGIKGIWNFTMAHITAPKGVAIKNENMAASLALLSKKINQNN